MKVFLVVTVTVVVIVPWAVIFSVSIFAFVACLSSSSEVSQCNQLCQYIFRKRAVMPARHMRLHAPIEQSTSVNVIKVNAFGERFGAAVVKMKTVTATVPNKSISV
mmetsp:Transcript_29400/g.51262  ORF Transcript_29400/g.51262 Transcript_29400/m.51262 type:complete len:106 (-) Transcript_29400:155-472(-)